MDNSGNLYGTTSGGGDAGCLCGTVSELTPAGQETVLYSLTSESGGQSPVSGLIADKNGNLYGTAPFPGANGSSGMVFELAPDRTLTTLHAFGGGKDGTSPWGGLVADVKGNLYGTTLNGGAHGRGTVYKLAPDGKEAILHSFNCKTDGCSPEDTLILDSAGDLYGTASDLGPGSCKGQGCGTVFKVKD